MLSPRLRARLARLHRWIALALSPVIVLILLSGAVLALRPIVSSRSEQAAAASSAKVDTRQLVALLRRLDSAQTARLVLIASDHRTITLFAKRQAPARSYDLVTGLPVPAPRRPQPGFFDYVQRIHTDLWTGGGVLVGLGTAAMLVLVILGPILSRPSRGPKTLLGWHIWSGWVLWPLFAFLPVSVVVMKFHSPITRDFSSPPLALAPAIEMASGKLDLSRLRAVQSFTGGAAFIALEGDDGADRHIVHAGTVQPLDNAVSSFAHALHTGTWAGAWSGTLNLVAALGLLAVLTTGVASWRQRSRRSAEVALRGRSPRPAS